VLVLGVLGAVLLGGLYLLTSSVAARTVPDTTVSVLPFTTVGVFTTTGVTVVGVGVAVGVFTW